MECYLFHKLSSSFCEYHNMFVSHVINVCFCELVIYLKLGNFYTNTKSSALFLSVSNVVLKTEVNLKCLAHLSNGYLHAQNYEYSCVVHLIAIYSVLIIFYSVYVTCVH